MKRNRTKSLYLIMKFNICDLVRLDLIEEDYSPIDFRTYNNKIGIYIKANLEQYNKFKDRCFIYTVDPETNILIDFYLEHKELIKI